jgi:hypothetical protein
VSLARLWELAAEVLDHTSRKGVGGVGGSGGGLAEVGDLFRDSTSMRVKIAAVIARRGGNTRASLRRRRSAPRPIWSVTPAACSRLARWHDDVDAEFFG